MGFLGATDLRLPLVAPRRLPILGVSQHGQPITGMVEERFFELVPKRVSESQVVRKGLLPYYRDRRLERPGRVALGTQKGREAAEDAVCFLR